LLSGSPLRSTGKRLDPLDALQELEVLIPQLVHLCLEPVDLLLISVLSKEFEEREHAAHHYDGRNHTHDETHQESGNVVHEARNEQ